MAETYGRLTGKAGVCLATLGPGAINLLLGVADATTNSTPLVALSAQVGMNRSFKESHQGVDLVSMFAPVTKWSALVATREAPPEMIRKAFKLAQTERPGAVYLAVPEDIESAVAPADARPLEVNVPRPDEPSPSQVARAAAILKAASNPIVLAGHGAARADAGPDLDPLRRVAWRVGGHHVPRQGRVPRRPPAGPGCDRVHASRLRELRFRPGRRHRHGRLRAPGVRPGSDQSSEATSRSSISIGFRPKSIATTTSPSGCRPISGTASTPWRLRSGLPLRESDHETGDPRPLGPGVGPRQHGRQVPDGSGTHRGRHPGGHAAATTSCSSTRAR